MPDDKKQPREVTGIIIEGIDTPPKVEPKPEMDRAGRVDPWRSYNPNRSRRMQLRQTTRRA